VFLSKNDDWQADCAILATFLWQITSMIGTVERNLCKVLVFYA
jgi:hypothetical protein